MKGLWRCYSGVNGESLFMVDRVEMHMPARTNRASDEGFSLYVSGRTIDGYAPAPSSRCVPVLVSRPKVNQFYVTDMVVSDDKVILFLVFVILGTSGYRREELWTAYGDYVEHRPGSLQREMAEMRVWNKKAAGR